MFLVVDKLSEDTFCKINATIISAPHTVLELQSHIVCVEKPRYSKQSARHAQQMHWVLHVRWYQE